MKLLLAHAYLGALLAVEDAVAFGRTRLQLFVFLHENPMREKALTFVGFLPGVRGNNQSEQYHCNQGLHGSSSFVRG